MSSPLLRLARDYAWPHRWSYAAGVACLLLTNWLTVAIPVRVGAAIDALRAGGSAGAPIAAVAAMGAAVIVVRTLSRVLIFNPGRDIEFRIRQDLFTRLLAQRAAFFAGRSTGEVLNRASNDITYVRALVGYGFMQVLNVTMALGLTGWRMVALSGRLTAAVIVPVLVGLSVVRVAIGRIMHLHHVSQRQLGELAERVLDSFQGIATVQGHAAEEAFERRFARASEALFRTRMRMSLLGSLAFPALVLAGGVALFLVLRVGGAMAVRGELSVGEVAAFAGLLAVLLPPLRSLGWMLSVVQRGRASLERILELMDAPVDRSPNERPVPTGRPPGFRIRGLTFAYPDEPDRPVLRDVDLDVPPGAVVGIFGRTGAGKTTLVRLLCRLYDPPRGAVAVVEPGGGELDLVDTELEGWRRRLAVAPQRPFLFSDTLAANVAMSDEPDEPRLRAAVEAAALGPDLEVLPDGIDTLVGERGVMLSGGQRQRVALARALLREADVLVLDDVLSAVDHATEARLLDTLARSARRPTTFIVSHRLGAFRRADLVVVLDGGRVVDVGTHDELVRRPGIYRDTWIAQRSGRPPAEEAAR